MTAREQKLSRAERPLRSMTLNENSTIASIEQYINFALVNHLNELKLPD